MSDPLTPDEVKYYQGKLNKAALIVKDIFEFEDEIQVYPLIAAVFERIASPLHFLRQKPYEGPDMINPETGKGIYFDKTPKKPSRIFGEGTQWRDKTDKHGRPYQYAGEHYLHDALHKSILGRLQAQKTAQPDAWVQEEAEGWLYWANPSSKGWYLNRRRLP